ncbi:MAG: 50S ribosomal protein L29 [Rhizomicrobium sp.]
MAEKKTSADTKAAKAASKTDEFRAKTNDELIEQLTKLKKEQFNLRFQRANGQLEKTSRIRVVRKEIARLETVLTEQRRKAV